MMGEGMVIAQMTFVQVDWLQLWIHMQYSNKPLFLHFIFKIWLSEMPFWNEDTLYIYGVLLIYCLVTILKRENGVSSTWPVLSEPILAFSDHLFVNINT